MRRTACSSIENLLRNKHGAHRVTEKHSTFLAFRETATDEELTYLSFATVRHPMDTVLSMYHKIKSDHRGHYAKEKAGQTTWGGRRVEQFNAIHNENLAASAFFLKYYRDADPTTLFTNEQLHHTLKHVDVVMHFENIQDDLDAVMKRLGLPIHQIPQLNRTQSRVDGLGKFIAFFAKTHSAMQAKNQQHKTAFSEEALALGRDIFAPYMQRFGYD